MTVCVLDAAVGELFFVLIHIDPPDVCFLQPYGRSSSYCTVAGAVFAATIPNVIAAFVHSFASKIGTSPREIHGGIPNVTFS